jgi:uncharacterized membrane protein
VTRLFFPILVLHVVIAVLGLGSILSIALVAAASRRAGDSAVQVSAWLALLLRVSASSLGAMLVTGVLMDAAAGGAFHQWWWFRGSALLLVLTGVLNARARRVVGRGLGPDAGRDAALRRIERLAYGMSALVAAITALMEVQPF